MKRTLSNKIENLIEITHHPDGNTELPLMSPYNLIDKWKSEGYTHLHFGAIRLVLTLHGRKGLPVTAKVALLDSTYKKYSDSLIGALLTTLSNGSVILTIQPDYNVSIFDRTLPGRLKVQIQITGAEQDSQAIMATLHHQIVYRLQNHALDLSLPNSTTDALVAISNRADDTSIIQIPRQIPKEELAQIMPMEWISNYESLFMVLRQMSILLLLQLPKILEMVSQKPFFHDQVPQVPDLLADS
ncbi:hypothetical protein K1719_000420 [Acacia pycnantha]|nr:hypothetical protein K1719_000420 [Acacia pycnantha]